MISLRCPTPESTRELGALLARFLWPGDVLALRGGLGAGKTMLAKGVAEGLGVEEEATSPTFTIVSVYEGRSMRLYHIDAYRLAGPGDFLELGADEMLYGDGACVIEWSERVEEALPPSAARITLAGAGEDGRTVSIDWPRAEAGIAGAVGARLSRALAGEATPC